MRAPVLAALFLIVTLATLAMPGSANFIGEFYILIGVFQAKIVYAFVAIVGVVFAAFYAIRLFQRTMHNRHAGGTSTHARSRSGTRRCWRRSSPASSPWRCIPGLILSRGEAAVQDKVAAVASSSEAGGARPLPRCAPSPGWTGYAPLGRAEDR